MKDTARRIFALILIVALSTALFGCQNQAGEGQPVASADETTEVKIGFAAPLTGDNALYGEGMKRAVELAIEEANASAEAKEAGVSFKLRAEDDAGDPKQAVNVANALSGDAAVVGVVGHFNSGCTIPASPVYNKANLAMITVSTNPVITSQGLDNVNRIVAKDDAQGVFAGELVGKLGYTKVALIDDGTPYGQGLATEFKKAFTEKGGQLVSEDRIQAKDVDFSALVTKIKGSKPDAVYYAGAHTEGALLTKQMKEGGLKIPVLGGDMLYSPDYVKIAGAANAEGDIATALGLPLDQQPKGAEFKSKYEEKYGAEPEAYDSYAYDAAWAIINAVMENKGDRVKVRDAVRAGSLDGVTGQIKFDANGDNEIQVISAYKVTAGEWKQIQE